MRHILNFYYFVPILLCSCFFSPLSCFHTHFRDDISLLQEEILSSEVFEGESEKSRGENETPRCARAAFGSVPKWGGRSPPGCSVRPFGGRWGAHPTPTPPGHQLPAPGGGKPGAGDDGGRTRTGPGWGRAALTCIPGGGGWPLPAAVLGAAPTPVEAGARRCPGARCGRVPSLRPLRLRRDPSGKRNRNEPEPREAGERRWAAPGAVSFPPLLSRGRRLRPGGPAPPGGFGYRHRGTLFSRGSRPAAGWSATLGTDGLPEEGRDPETRRGRVQLEYLGLSFFSHRERPGRDSATTRGAG